MPLNKTDQITETKTGIEHQSAGGFVFFEDPKTHELYVPVLKQKSGEIVIPKGHLKKKEKPADAGLREVTEELTLNKKPKIVSFIGKSNYSFKLDDDKVHHKTANLYVYSVDNKESIRPIRGENFKSARWMPFYKAVDGLTYDKDWLLAARQKFYFKKKYEKYRNITDVKSLTIALPTHNGSSTIQNTFQSIINRLNDLPPDIKKEFIICTDHCSDNTAEIVRQSIENSKGDIKNIKIRILDNPGPKGKSTVLNYIFKHSEGHLFCVIDDDVDLAENTFNALIQSLVENFDLRCVFARWERTKFRSKNPIALFWHWILGVKFDIQPYDKKSEIARGACLMYRRSDFVYMSPSLYNEDQFIQYMYWPNTKEVQDAVIRFHSVTSIVDYYKRFIRIMVGIKQMDDQFSKQRNDKCKKDLFRKIDQDKIKRLPLKQKLPFYFYRFIRYWINISVQYRLKNNKKYEWFRIKQN